LDRKQCTRARQAPEDRRYYGQAGEPGADAKAPAKAIRGPTRWRPQEAADRGLSEQCCGCQAAGRGLERLPSARARLAATMSADVDMGLLGAGGL